jgi:hypothetical protein
MEGPNLKTMNSLGKPLPAQQGTTHKEGLGRSISLSRSCKSLYNCCAQSLARGCHTSDWRIPKSPQPESVVHVPSLQHMEDDLVETTEWETTTDTICGH